jgi:hypothetical protein
LFHNDVLHKTEPSTVRSVAPDKRRLRRKGLDTMNRLQTLTSPHPHTLFDYGAIQASQTADSAVVQQRLRSLDGGLNEAAAAA